MACGSFFGSEYVNLIFPASRRNVYTSRRILAAWADDDLHVLPKRCQRLHEALQRNAPKLVIPDRGDLRLGHAEQLRCVGLSETAALNDVVDLLGQDSLGGELFGIPESKVSEDVIRAAILRLVNHFLALLR